MTARGPRSGSRPAARRWQVVGATLLLLGGVGSCTGEPPPTPTPTATRAPRPLEWRAVDLPGGAAPLLVESGPSAVLVAARTGEQASMFRLPGSGVPQPVTVQPHSVYAPTARWVDLATDGSRVLALGRAAGGAHGLPRWTVWEGTTTRLVERPQPFETFGGPRSGGLAAVAVGREEVLVGTWDDGGPGLDARLWTRTSPRAWDRTPVAAALASTASVLPQPAAVAWSSTRLVVVGSATDLGESASVTTRATTWTAPGTSGSWTRQDLPTASSSARATDATCDGERCWVVGLDGERPAAWLLTSGGVARLPLPAVPPAPDSPPALALAGGSPWVALAGPDGTVLARRQGAGWVCFDGPPGRPVSLATSAGLVDLVTTQGTTSRLWTARVG